MLVAMYVCRISASVRACADSKLQFTFSKIDPANPSRPFSFAVLVDDDEKYQGSTFI
jgi:hypothetical protein